ncbi:MAG: hypothetical protein WDO18_06755 [Acidobacteriota bacterium]
MFGRSTNKNIPFFSKRANISGLAGITGNNQDPINWGPAEPKLPWRHLRPRRSAIFIDRKSIQRAEH